LLALPPELAAARIFVTGGTMAGRGPQTFKKRQKEQQRKERQQEKMEKRLQRRRESGDREQSGPEMGEPVERFTTEP
jgi:hypothetical protein